MFLFHLFEGIAIPLSVKGTSFFNFIKVCDSKSRDSVYQSLAQEKYECEKSMSLVDQKYSGICATIILYERNIE